MVAAQLATVRSFPAEVSAAVLAAAPPIEPANMSYNRSGAAGFASTCAYAVELDLDSVYGAVAVAPSRTTDASGPSRRSPAKSSGRRFPSSGAKNSLFWPEQGILRNSLISRCEKLAP